MYDITDYGAVGDGATLNTAAIQRALDECGKRGGTVTVPPGIWLTGTLWLRSNTELRLETGAVLLGSADLADYNEPDAYPQNSSAVTEGWSGKHLILAIEVENVALTGGGCIDGNGRAFFEAEPSRPGDNICWRGGLCRPKNFENGGRPGQEIVFVESRNIRVRDLELRDMCCWGCFFYGCENVQVTGLRIENGIRNVNTDGIDIDCCRDVTVSDCIIHTGDDAIAVRGAPSRLKNQGRICENVVIRNCIFRVNADAIRIGVGNGVIRDVLISGVVIERSGRGIHLQNCYGKAIPGVDISEVIVSDVIIRRTGTPIMVAAGSEKSTAAMRDIVFRDVLISAFGSVIVAGAGGTRVENVSLSGILFEDEEAEEGAAIDREAGPLHTEDALFRIEEAHDVRLEECRFRGASRRKALSLHRVTGLRGEPLPVPAGPAE